MSARRLMIDSSQQHESIGSPHFMADDRTIHTRAEGCPTDDRLAGLLAGTLEESSHEWLENHIGQCGRCQHRLEELAVEGTDWKTWQNRMETVHFQRVEINAAPEVCPTCGSSGISSEGPQIPASENSLPLHLKPTVHADTMSRVAWLERELPNIPGYECESLIGRGGMGVVYRARQLALNRLVALKMIVTGRHATLQQLARFQIEAEALACLTHENIVQIYEFGEHDAGPYLALEFVEGQSLDDILKQKRHTPSEAARLCLTLARAMHAAHAHGVVHRDLKPANILITKTGQPKITDFGLAKRLSENSQWTRTDTVMGTPHYMAPEQAGGESQSVGPLADVYSLGTILYELLAGIPPFTEGNMAELLGQICSLPPKSIRKQNPRVPRDLETICLRCLEKDRSRRYESAEALADDLERFLKNCPIEARPIGPVERLAKWTKRRPAIALLLLGLIASVFVMTTGGVFYSMQLRRERDRAELNFQLATKALDQFLENLEEENFLIEPHFEERRKELLQAGLTYAQQLAAEEPENPAMQRNLGFCHRRLGDIHRLMGNHEAAQVSYQKAIEILNQLRRAKPHDPEVSLQLAAAYASLGELERQTSAVQQAEKSYRIALQLYEELLEADPNQPDSQAEYARVLYNLAILHKETAGPENAEGHQDKLNHARQLLNSATARLTILVERFPSNRQYAQHLARSYINLGSVMRLQKSLRKGRTPYQLAIQQLEKLCKRYPSFAEYQYELALAHNNLGNLLSDDNQFAEAIGQHEQAEKTFQRLVEDHPSLPQFRQQLAITYNSLAVVNYKLGNSPETRKAWQSGLAELETLVSQSPDLPDYHGDLGMIRGNLGSLELKENNPAAAIGPLKAAIPDLRAALNANLDHPVYSSASKKACRDLVKAYQWMGQFDQTFREVETLLNRNPARPVDLWLAAALLGQIRKASESDAANVSPVNARKIHKLAARILQMVDSLSAVPKDFQSKPEFETLRGQPAKSP